MKGTPHFAFGYHDFGSSERRLILCLLRVSGTAIDDSAIMSSAGNSRIPTPSDLRALRAMNLERVVAASRVRHQPYPDFSGEFCGAGQSLTFSPQPVRFPGAVHHLPDSPLQPLDESSNVYLRPPMETGVHSQLLPALPIGHQALDPFEDPRNEVATQVHEQVARSMTCVEIVTSYTLRLENHAFTVQYSKQLQGFIRDVAHEVGIVTDQLSNACRQMDDFVVVKTILMIATDLADRTEAQWLELKKKVAPFLLPVEEQPDESYDDGEDMSLNELEENLFKPKPKPKHRLKAKFTVNTDGSTVPFESPASAPSGSAGPSRAKRVPRRAKSDATTGSKSKRAKKEKAKPVIDVTDDSEAVDEGAEWDGDAGDID